MRRLTEWSASCSRVAGFKLRSDHRQLPSRAESALSKIHLMSLRKFISLLVSRTEFWLGKSETLVLPFECVSARVTIANS